MVRFWLREGYRDVKISTVIERADGNYEFKAELTPEQHAFLIEFAVKELLRAGLIPFAQADTAEEIASVIPATHTEYKH